MPNEKKEFWYAMLFDFGIPLLVTVISLFVSAAMNNWTIKYDDVIIAILSFLLTFNAIHMIKLELKLKGGSFIRRQHFIDKSLDIGESVISSLLSHLSEDCYNRCSKNSNKCIACEKFPKKCNGLLRNYLLEESGNFQKSIEMAKKGQYRLSTNIELFHTIAVDHLIGFGCKAYSVIHWFGNDIPKEKDYNELDINFLKVLLDKLKEKREDTNGKPYYEYMNFKIKWLLIGNIENINNTYNYIFDVIEQTRLTDTVASTLFEFYHMEENEYQNRMTAKFNQLSDSWRAYFRTKPNVGIFGSYFMFVESENKFEYGTIYTKNHVDGNKGSVSQVIDFFDKALEEAGSAIPYDTLKQKFDSLPKEN